MQETDPDMDRGDDEKGKKRKQHLHMVHNEHVYYDSAKAKRTICGRCVYCMTCPNWEKASTARVQHSAWEKSEVGCCELPTGRSIDQFDADIIVDVEAHQTLCQICRDEGDIHIHRNAAGDASNPEAVFTMLNVPKVFSVFNEMTYELSKLNLGGLAQKGMGQRMGAVVYDFDARSGATGPVTRQDKELMFYNSDTAERTLIGRCCHMDCCCPGQYRFTSERVMYTTWEFCECCSYCPKGRTVNFFDADIIVDIGAHQRCSQMCLNEGDLLVYRVAGADTSDGEQVFRIPQVPEVFATFDDLSCECTQPLGARRLRHPLTLV